MRGAWGGAKSDPKPRSSKGQWSAYGIGAAASTNKLIPKLQPLADPQTRPLSLPLSPKLWAPELGIRSNGVLRLLEIHTPTFPGGSDGKASACSAGDLGSIPGLGRSPRGGHSNPFQYCSWRIPRLEEPHGLWSTGIAESDTTEPLRAQTQETAFSKESSFGGSRFSVFVS